MYIFILRIPEHFVVYIYIAALPFRYFLLTPFVESQQYIYSMNNGVEKLGIEKGESEMILL